MNSSVTRIFAPFYSSAFSWNFALGMTQLLIPLYARDLGYSGVAIGSLIALPIIVQMIFNLIGGAWTDRIGGRDLGYSGVAIGSLIALPIIVQMIFNLIGGAWTDRIGGMNISLVAFAATAAAGIM